LSITEQRAVGFILAWSLAFLYQCYVDYNPSNWLDLLPSTEFTYNNQVHKGIKESSFFLEYSRLLQTSFGHISINSSTILMVSMAMESP